MRPDRLVRLLAVAFLACVASPLAASAQVTTATVVGTVKDSQGGVIPGATVTLTSEKTRPRDSGDVLMRKKSAPWTSLTTNALRLAIC